jgi:hypothetical protein
MPLAGSMKLRTFLLLMGVAVALAGLGLYQACKRDDDGGGDKKPIAKAPAPDAAVRREAPTTTPDAAPVVPSVDLAPRAYDAEVLAWQGKPVAGGKGKDVSKGKAYKISVYQDKGFQSANRVKVDLDRDDKWDEKYTFEPDKVTLQRAPADDEQYRETFHWTTDGWVFADAGAEKPAPAKPPETTIVESGTDLAARPHDADVLAFEGRAIGSDKIKDAVAGRAFKVNVYQDAGKSTVNRAKVDLDGDEKWDEKYTFEPGKITLQRAPADDEKYTETFHWTGDGWAKAK